MQKRLAVLISNTGTGTNLQAIINVIESKQLDAQIVAVVSDTEEAKGLERARNHKLPIVNCRKKEDLLSVLKNLELDFVCLCGWKQIITDDVISTFENKVLNLHPGLIPDDMSGSVSLPDGSKGLWNKGKLTDKAIQNFFAQKATYAGSSIHFLTNEFDFGPVLGRTFEKVKNNDNVESLYARLKKKENELYVEVLKKLCNN